MSDQQTPGCEYRDGHADETPSSEETTMNATIPVVDYGTINRDRQGRFTKTYTLRYDTHVKGSVAVVKLVRHLPAKGIETVGKVLMKVSEDVAWNIEVLDSNGMDCTFDFECFQD